MLIKKDGGSGDDDDDDDDDGIDHSTPQCGIVVRDGDMLVMRHVTQQYRHHRVPPNKGTASHG